MINAQESYFRGLVERDFLYVDKTGYMLDIIENYRYVFASRPRRFGKSITLTAFAEIFKGNKELFKDLAICNSDYDWKKYPVLQFDFSTILFSTKEQLEANLLYKILDLAKDYDITIEPTSEFTIALTKLIKALGASVVLVDEYDTPLIDVLSNKELLEDARVVLGKFFSTLKSLSSYLRFVYITGITKFAKVSLFSSMNNLEDISMDPAYADFFGFTEEELEKYFDEYIEEGAEKTNQSREEYLLKICEYYDGYRFTSSPLKVYNPISINNFFKYGGIEFNQYWNATGNSTLAYTLSSRVNFDIASELPFAVSKEAIERYFIEDVKKLTKEQLVIFLSQAGILAISDYKDGLYYFDFPNKEVKVGFIDGLADLITIGGSRRELYSLFNEGETKEAMERLEEIFASIEYEEYENRFIRLESFYHKQLSAIFCSSEIREHYSSEERVSKGRSDIILRTEKAIYVIELKVDKSADVAFDQIVSNQYAEKFKDSSREVHLLGINFSSETKNIDGWKETILHSSSK